MLKTGHHRIKFLKESINDLNSSLQEKGSQLIIKYGESDQIIAQMIEELDSEAKIYTHKDICDEEIRITRKVQDRIHLLKQNQSYKQRQEKASSNSNSNDKNFIKEYWGSTLYHFEDLPMDISQFPNTYSTFRNQVEKKSRVRDIFPVPATLKPPCENCNNSDNYISTFTSNELPSIEELIGAYEMNQIRDKRQKMMSTSEIDENKGVLIFQGGERAGIERLHEYFFNTDSLRNYKETRNGMLGANYSSKFSPWLAHGCLSPRYIYAMVKKYEQERIANNSTYWLIFELIWRDYFQFYGLYHGIDMFQLGGPQRKPNKQRWLRDRNRFEAWCEGKTGYPYIDANMRELNATGFMSNRGRQNVASFLTKDLELDWRLGAEYFEKILIDHDPCSNWGNWNYVAGVGSDPREGRYFNIVKQGHNYDKHGDYVRHWVPELAEVPTAQLHNANPVSQQFRNSLNISEDVYPRPIVPLKFGAFNPSTGKGTDSKGGRAPFNGRGYGKQGGQGKGNNNNGKGGNNKRDRKSRLQHHEF